jgi:hypothetical protein
MSGMILRNFIFTEYKSLTLQHEPKSKDKLLFSCVKDNYCIDVISLYGRLFTGKFHLQKTKNLTFPEE